MTKKKQAAKPKLGRPFKTAEDVRVKRLVVRLTTDEEMEIVAHAAHAGIPVSTLVRWGLAGLGLGVARK
jgi:hypothetical protein